MNQARKKQVIIGLISGLIVGFGIAAITQFWWWLPTGVILGLASGLIMNTPDENPKTQKDRKRGSGK